MTSFRRSSFRSWLDLHSGVPAYRQIIDQVHGAIASGTLTSVDQLFTARQLAVDLSINPNTVVRAHRELELGGLLETHQDADFTVDDLIEQLRAILPENSRVNDHRALVGGREDGTRQNPGRPRHSAEQNPNEFHLNMSKGAARMKRLLEVCFVALSLADGALMVVAQTADVPMQRGIAVDQPVMHNAVPIPEADKEDAVVVTLTQDGSVYLGINRTSIASFSKEIRNTLSNRNVQIVYIKADAHVPYSTVVRIMDHVCAAGIQRFGLLTAKDSDKPGALVTPKGLEMQIVSAR
jgi:DNA-binding transcriptional regulator YhcF (GntR family)/biopolymer transport protein ExbD